MVLAARRRAARRTAAAGGCRLLRNCVLLAVALDAAAAAAVLAAAGGARSPAFLSGDPATSDIALGPCPKWSVASHVAPRAARAPFAAHLCRGPPAQGFRARARV